MFKITLLSAVATLALGSAAHAAAPGWLTGTPSAPWTGPYVGLHGGAAWDNDSAVKTSGQLTGNINNVLNLARPDTVNLNREGYVAGGQIGYNVQYGSIVLGTEADISVTDLNDKVTYRSPVTFGAAPAGTRSDVSGRYNYLGSVRSRVGLANDRFMGYVTGGIAYGEVRDRAVYSNGAAQRVDFAVDHTYTPTGWVAGVGGEYAIPVGFLQRFGASRVTLRAEYLHYDLGTKSLTIASTGGTGAYNTTYDHQADVIRGGLNFKF